MSKTIRALLFIAFFILHEVNTFRCDRRPYGTTNQASPSDGRFKLDVMGIDNAYIPEQVYTVQLISTDDDSTFVGFMISAEGDIKPEPRNPRRTMTMNPGELRPLIQTTAKFSDRCLYTLEQSTISIKSSVEVYWQAPPSGNGCVTLRAMVAENDESWFEDGSPLTRKLCEDMRQPDDVAPQLNYECSACDEAKYEITFSGIWSRNTHPRMYPENDWVPKYSDLVGASHVADFILWSPGTLASDGLKDLAEHANSSKIEAEMREKIGDGVRTLLKGKGHGYRKMTNPTYAFCRVDKSNHLISVAVGIYPSPDWFLGVTRFDLCQGDNTWLPERELNLYPWDAGTDSGVSYESVNIETFPQDAVSRVQMSSYDKNSPFYEMDIKDMHPFGKLHIKLIRTYHRECEEETTGEEGETTTEKEPNGNETEETEESKATEPEQPSRYQNPEIASSDVGGESPLVTDPVSTEECHMSQWQEWSSCEGPCDGGIVNGLKWRERYHLVDGVPVEKYDPSARHRHRKVVSKYCKRHFETFERMECEEACETPESDDITVERRVMAPILPGATWNSKRRDVMKNKLT